MFLNSTFSEKINHNSNFPISTLNSNSYTRKSCVCGTHNLKYNKNNLKETQKIFNVNTEDLNVRFKKNFKEVKTSSENKAFHNSSCYQCRIALNKSEIFENKLEDSSDENLMKVIKNNDQEVILKSLIKRNIWKKRNAKKKKKKKKTKEKVYGNYF